MCKKFLKITVNVRLIVVAINEKEDMMKYFIL